ncbi:MAG: hypothetical protein ACRD2A_09965 [Vicinamibacterales bacterium]
MSTKELKFGSPNPNAAPELSRFAFLVGEWRCDARLKRDDGSWEKLQAKWVGRWALDGYVILDEYRMTRPTGELLVLGLNVRSYDVNKKVWTMKWLNALGGNWTDLGSDALGGLTMDERSITYVLHEPVAGHAFTRATYFDISEEFFGWRGERSNNRKEWEEFLVIEAHRCDT